MQKNLFGGEIYLYNDKSFIDQIMKNFQQTGSYYFYKPLDYNYVMFYLLCFSEDSFLGFIKKVKYSIGNGILEGNIYVNNKDVQKIFIVKGEIEDIQKCNSMLKIDFSMFENEEDLDSFFEVLIQRNYKLIIKRRISNSNTLSNHLSLDIFF